VQRERVGIEEDRQFLLLPDDKLGKATRSRKMGGRQGIGRLTRKLRLRRGRGSLAERKRRQDADK
jgi:hypothetical protein